MKTILCLMVCTICLVSIAKLLLRRKYSDRFTQICATLFVTYIVSMQHLVTLLKVGASFTQPDESKLRILLYIFVVEFALLSMFIHTVALVYYRNSVKHKCVLNYCLPISLSYIVGIWLYTNFTLITISKSAKELGYVMCACAALISIMDILNIINYRKESVQRERE